MISPTLTMSLPPAPLKMLGTAILVRIVLIRTLVIDIMFVVHLLGLFLCLSLSLFAVEPVLALGLCLHCSQYLSHKS
jgi:hypothetical protein